MRSTTGVSKHWTKTRNIKHVRLTNMILKSASCKLKFNLPYNAQLGGITYFAWCNECVVYTKSLKFQLFFLEMENGQIKKSPTSLYRRTTVKHQWSSNLILVCAMFLDFFNTNNKMSTCIFNRNVIFPLTIIHQAYHYSPTWLLN